MRRRETSTTTRSRSSFPNDFTREWIEGHFLGFVKAAARDSLGRDIRVTLTVRDPGADASRRRPSRDRCAADRPRMHRRRLRHRVPKYTFDSFVIGSSNRFAHAAALAVAEAPAQAYNPLFIYGGTGLGKTHLLQAIGQYVSEHTKGSTIAVRHERDVHERLHQLAPRQARSRASSSATAPTTSCSSTTSSSSRARSGSRRSSSTRSTRSTRPAGRSSSPPTGRRKEIATLEERLRSRFEWGLITDIQPPDLETRIAILRKKVTTRPDRDRRPARCSRSSRAASRRTSASSRARSPASSRSRRSPAGQLTVELAEEVLRDLFPQGEASPR